MVCEDCRRAEHPNAFTTHCKLGRMAERTDTECKYFIKKSEDNINSPSHYTSGKIETIDYIQDKLTKEEMIGAMKFNIIKYISRERLKNGLEDCKKAQYYLNKLVTLMEGKTDGC